MSPESVKRRNRTALLLMLVSFLLIFLLLSLPAYEFQAGIYTKKSSPKGGLYYSYSAVNGSNAILRARLMATVTWR